MKVLHITTNDFGGAGLAVLRIHRALISQGVDSRVLVSSKHSQEQYVYEFRSTPINVYKSPKNPILRKIKKILRRRGYLLTKKEQFEYALHRLQRMDCVFSSPISSTDLLQSELLKDADIIHLHWIANFVDYATFFKGTDKPIVWTLHDENIAYGGFHYKVNYEKYYPIVKEIEDAYAIIKQEALTNRQNLHMIALSTIMKEFIENLSFLNEKNISLIHNCVEYPNFNPFDKTYARSVFGIEQDEYVFAFCAYRINDPRKGLIDLVHAVEQLENKKNRIICIGGGDIPCETKINIDTVGELCDDRLISLVYATSDVFVMPSYQEAFAQTPLEAMSCGLPVISYPCSGAKDLIKDFNGVVCDDFTVESLIRAIQLVMSRQYNPGIIRQNIIDNYSPTKIATQYLEVYNKALVCY